MPLAVEIGSFSETAAGKAIALTKYFNVTVTGTFEGTLLLERSFDKTEFTPLTQDFVGTPVQITGPVSVVAFEPENGVYYRLRCSEHISGTASWRLSQ